MSKCRDIRVSIAAVDPGQLKFRMARAEPFFTIITAVYNGAATLQACIDSVSGQSFRDFEYIVMDGASTDGTVAMLRANSSRIDKWISEPDSGIYNAWNKALDHARGQWIAFLGSDDVYLPHALQEYARAIDALPAPDTQFVSSRVQLVKSQRVVRTIGQPWSWPAFSRFMTVAHVGAMHHRSLFEQYGRFDESYRLSADYELLLRRRSQLRAAWFDTVTARMALGGVSNNNTRRALLEQQRAKHTAGGRPGWLCGLERHTAYVKHVCRSVIWY